MATQIIESQTKQILRYLQKGKSLTPIDALNKFSCFRLGSRIYDIKKLGHTIERKMVEKNGKHFASYKLVK